MAESRFNVLFLCTGNSARSILAECALNRLGGDRFKAYSAGSQPVGFVQPHALALLESNGYDVSGLRSKSWDEFAAGDAPRFDLVVTVCAGAAGETCPIWPGSPLRAYWGLPDPAKVEGSDAEKQKAFADTLRALESRIGQLVDLPVEKLSGAALQRRLDEIGSIAHAGA
jgi:protein-tyrosine-phosphatase